MADDPGNGSVQELWCPSCLTMVGNAHTCMNCGLSQKGETPARLRVIVARIHEATEERNALAVELQQLHEERVELFAGPPSPGARRPVPAETGSDVSGRTPAPARGDWRPERVRDVLLWLGSVLLIISAITFVVVAWARLSPFGRAGILAAATLIAGALTRTLRTRLKATAEALAALTIGLAAVDWRALERTTLSRDVSTAAWWAIGLATIGVVAFALGRRSPLTTLRIAPVFAIPAAAATAIIAMEPTAAEAAFGLAMIATVVTTAHAARRRSGQDDGVTSALAFIATTAELATIAVAGIALVRPIAQTAPDPVRSLAGPALALLAIAAAPLVALLLRRDDAPKGTTDLLATIVTLAPIGAIAAAAGPSLEAHATLAVVAGLALTLTLITRLLPVPWQPGARVSGAIAFLPPLVGIVADVTAAWIAPIRWLSEPWTGSLAARLEGNLGPTGAAAVHHALAVELILGALALAAIASRGRILIGRAIGGIAAAMGLAVALAVFNPTIGVALVVDLSVAVALLATALAVDRRDPTSARDLLITAEAVLLPGVGWAAVTESATIAGLAVVGIASFTAAIGGTTSWLRRGAATLAASAVIAETGAVAHTLGASLAVVGFSMFVAAGATLVAARFRHQLADIHVPVEAVAFVGGFIGISVAGASPTWRAVSLSMCVPLFVLAALRRDDHSEGYAILASLAAVATTVSLVDHASATVESFSIPAAVVAIGLGLMNRTRETASSWSTIGPGLIVGFAPSVAIAMERGGALRPVIVLLAAGVTVLLGARAGQRAPIVVGSISILALAIDGIAPLAADLPRWLLIGTIGALALWAGATADRRLDQLRRWRNSIDALS